MVVADDSGLSVRALDGAPACSASATPAPDATYADNCRRLLEELEAPKTGGRDRLRAGGARRHGEMLITSGVSPGVITPAPREEGGFGYDPVFVPADERRRWPS